jgi:Tetratricopeptide repeat
MERGSSFEALRRLATCFEKLDVRAARKLIVRLGGVAMPMLLRELSSERAARADLSRALISALLEQHPELHARTLRGLRALQGHARDDVRARALAALAELDRSAPDATFADPEEVQRRSAMALAEQLGSAADVAAAADLMTKRLDPEEMVSLLEIMTETTPDQAAKLVHELSCRVDLDGSVRSEVRRLAAATWIGSEGAHESANRTSNQSAGRSAGRSVGRSAGQTTGRSARSPGRRSNSASDDRAPDRGPDRGPGASVLILHDGRGSQVVIAVRSRGNQRRWRRFAVLVGADGAVEDCLYEDDVPAAELSDPMNAPLLCGLLAEGYRLIGDDPAHGRTIAAEAARRAAAIPHRLTSAYYLGRDILDLGDVHLGPRNSLGELATAIGRAVDLLAAGDVERARDLAARCARISPDNPDVASTLGQCHLAAGELTAAAEWLARAAAAEPGWPMHHWNLAAVHHRAECASACADALASYLAAVERRGGERPQPADREQAERVAMARRYVAANRPAPAPAASQPASPSSPRRSRRGLADRSKPVSPARARED